VKNSFLALLGILFFLKSIGVEADGTKKRKYAEMEESHSHTPEEVQRVPIVYDPKYNFDLFGLEKRHPFSKKQYSRIVQYLIQRHRITPDSWYLPMELTERQLRTVHTRDYLRSLADPSQVFKGFETLSPRGNSERETLIRKEKEIADRIVSTQRLGSGGTVLAGELALHPPYWAINLSGGYHHAYAEKGSGFCLIADAAIAIRKILHDHPNYQVLIVDLDAHHGDGNAAIFADDARVHIFDIYNSENFPFPLKQQYPIEFDFPVPKNMRDPAYLRLLASELPRAISKTKPDLIVYNAGTDIFQNDPCGKFKISAAGIIQRDEIVFTLAKKAGIPILMVLSGGYAVGISEVIGQSIENLFLKEII
jgi:histone deacetylase 11